MKIITDSSCDLPEELKKSKEIEQVPFVLQLGDEVFVDDENLDVSKYIDRMVNSKHIPKTAAPAPDLFISKFEGDEDVFCLVISSHLSSSYNNAKLAQKISQEENKDKFIHVFDSLTASAGQTLIALKIKEYIEANMSSKSIVENISLFIENMKTYFILERYDNLVKNGRVSNYIAKLADVLNIKPICCADEGEIGMLSKARGFSKAIDKLIKLILNDDQDFENKILTISHVEAPEKALSFKEKISKKIKFKDIIISETSGLCSTYADKGGIVIAY